jgi:hypothetical protein
MIIKEATESPSVHPGMSRPEEHHSKEKQRRGVIDIKSGKMDDREPWMNEPDVESKEEIQYVRRWEYCVGDLGPRELISPEMGSVQGSQQSLSKRFIDMLEGTDGGGSESHSSRFIEDRLP